MAQAQPQAGMPGTECIGPNGRYQTIRELGEGQFGVAKMAHDRLTGEVVAIKFIKRGNMEHKTLEREILNHRSLSHPNVIGFHEVFLTEQFLAIVMEFAAGGELYGRVVSRRRFEEPEARYFFQQLVCGLDHCHKKGICHRDLKLENTLLDSTGETSAPRLKICDFGYSKSAHLDSKPKSTVGTPAYVAPEVLKRSKAYSGESADTWSCGVMLYVMLYGMYPFEDPNDQRNYAKTINKIAKVEYYLPQEVPISEACMDIILRIFVADPDQRITLSQIRSHPWFVQNLPRELLEDTPMQAQFRQSEEEVRAVLQAAATAGGPAAAAAQLPGGMTNASFGLSSLGSLPMTGSLAAELFNDDLMG